MRPQLPGVKITDSLAGIEAHALDGFFAGWPTPPTPAEHLAIMRASAYVSVASTVEGDVVGFITAISDRVFAAYITLLEVRTDFQARGIGAELVEHMKEQVRHCYMVDLICDPELLPFYQRCGMTPYSGAVIRNYDYFARRAVA